MQDKKNMEPKNKSNGAIIGSIIIVLVLIIGGIYLYSTKIAKAPEVPVVNSDDAEAAAINADLDVFDTENTDGSTEFNIDSSVEGL